MMQFSRVQFEAALERIRRFCEFDVVENEKDIFVIAESSIVINEFESVLSAASVEWDGEDCNGLVLLETLTNIQGNRTEFRQRRTTDEWQARYSITVR
jgi:hypothetical protein